MAQIGRPSANWQTIRCVCPPTATYQRTAIYILLSDNIDTTACVAKETGSAFLCNFLLSSRVWLVFVLPTLSFPSAPAHNPRNLKPRLWEFAIKYMDRSSSLGVEIAFVWWGPTFVMLCFAGVAALARLWGLAACGGKGGGGGEGATYIYSARRFYVATALLY